MSDSVLQQAGSFRLESLEKLVLYSSKEVRLVSWIAELPMIRRFYARWGATDIEPPSEDEAMGDIIALVRGGEILSMCAPFSFQEGEVEIGAVFTLPEFQGQGYCRQVISALARKILQEGLTVTLTTRHTNISMQRAAEAIGMERVFEEV